MSLSDPDLVLRLAARAMGRHGLAHAYGHVSVRIDAGTIAVCLPVPLTMVPVGAAAVRVPLEGPLPEDVLPEIRMHRAIYRARSDVNAICRVQPPAAMALSALGRTPRALHGLGTYFAPYPPLWDSTALVRDEESAAAVAAALGSARAIVLRGNGLVAVGAEMAQAAAHVWFLEDAARVELAVLNTGIPAREYTAGECNSRAIGTGGLYERMWDFLCYGDPEQDALEITR